MARDRRVNYDITATDKTQQAIDSVKRNLLGVNSAVMSLKSAVATLVPAFAAIGIGVWGKEVLNMADSLGKLAERVGVSVESLSTLRYAAQLSDVSIEALGNGLKKLSVNMLDTQAGTGEARDAFRALGIEVSDSSGKLRAGDEVMLDIADRFAGMKDGAGKTALAVKLFGRAGADMIPFLNQGREGIAAMTREADRFGLKVTTETAKAAQDFNDNVAALGFAAKGAAQAMVNPLLPALNDIAAALKRGAEEGNTLKGALEAIRVPIIRMNLGRFGDTPGEQVKNLEAELAKIDRLRGSFAGKFVPDALLGIRESNLLALLEVAKRDMPDFVGDTGLPTPPRKGRAPALPDEAARARASAAATFLGKQWAEDQEEWNKTMAEAAEVTDKFNQKMREQQYWENMGLRADQYHAIIEAINEEERQALEQGAILTQDVTENHKKLELQLRRNQDVAREFGLQFKSALEDIIIEGGKARDVIRALIQDIARVAIRKTVTEPLLGGLGKMLEGIDLFGTGPTPVQLSGPKAHGGSFRVAGGGGTDSQLVAFRATPGETVNVQTPGQAGGRSVTIIQNNYIDSRSDFASIMAAMSQSKAQALAEVADLLQRGDRGVQYAGSR